MPIINIKKCLNCGVAHEWLFSGMTLKELREVKKLTGMKAKDFASAGDDGDPEALAALVWILHKRAKITVPFDDVDLDFNDFSMEPTDEEQKEMDALEKRMQKAAEEGKDPKET